MDLSPRRLALATLDTARRWLGGGDAGTTTVGRLGADPGSQIVRVGAGRFDGQSGQNQGPAHLDACGSGGGCGDLTDQGRNWFGSPRELLEFQAGLSWELIDYLCVDELMNKIATLLPEDACAVKPELTGPTLGELDDVWASLARRGYAEVEERRLIFSFKYGAGATVCFVEDGRRADQPVDLANVREVLGYYSLPRHWVIPDQPSANVRAGWWGTQAGRPEHYRVQPSSATASVDQFDPGSDFRELLAQSGQKFHASRIIASPYRPELDWRAARRYPNWRGWGPGIVEGVVPVFEARRWGMLRVFDFMNGLGYDVLTSANTASVTAAKSTPSGGSDMRAFLRGLKNCRDFTGEGVPLVALDPGLDLHPLTRQSSGIDDLTEAQRKMLLDYVPYPRVVLYGEATGGLNGGGAEGEWQQYHRAVAKYNAKRRWPGLRQAAILEMASRRGPTGGQVDLDIEADFPSAWQASDAERSRSRKEDAEARALDAATFGLTPEAMAQLDPSIERAYPGLTATLEAAAARRRARVAVPPGMPAPPLAAPVGPAAIVQPPQAAAPGSAPAVTPAAAVQANAAQGTPQAPTVDAAPTSMGAAAGGFADVDDAYPLAVEPGDDSPLAPLAPVASSRPAPMAPPAFDPSDTATEVSLATALQMSRGAFRKWAAGLGIRPVATLGRGARGGDRYSVSEVRTAARARTDARLDSLKVSPLSDT